MKTVRQGEGIQPNLIQEHEPVVNFYEKVTWFDAMTKEVQRHSEFMRPEVSDNYPDMEYTYPDIFGMDKDGPQIVFDKGGVYAPLACDGCSFSIISEAGPIGDDIDDQLCFPYSNVFCMSPDYYQNYMLWTETGEIAPGFDPSALAAEAAALAAGRFTINQTAGPDAGLQVVAASDRYANHYMCIEPTTGRAKGIWPYQLAPFDSTFTVQVTFRDAYGNECTDTESVTPECENDTGRTALAFDAATTPDQITAGSSIIVTFLGGCPQYSWVATAGDGFVAALYPTSADTDEPVHGVTVNYDSDCGEDCDPWIQVECTDHAGMVENSGHIPIVDYAGWVTKGYGTSSVSANNGPPCDSIDEDSEFWYSGFTERIIDGGDALHSWLLRAALCAYCFGGEDYPEWTVGVAAVDGIDPTLFSKPPAPCATPWACAESYDQHAGCSDHDEDWVGMPMGYEEQVWSCKADPEGMDIDFT